MSAPVVFIHGLFQTSAMWSSWRARFERAGFETHAPDLPGHTPAAEQSRARPDPALAQVDAHRALASLEASIDRLDAPPVLVAHSIGGLFAQVLAARGKAAAAALLAPGAPNGLIVADPRFLKANVALVSPLARGPVFTPTRQWFHRNYATGLSRAESDRLWEESVVPESRLIPRTAASKQLRIDFRAPHPPLLFVSGSRDRLIPVRLNRRNARAWQDPDSSVEHWVLHGQSHTLCVEAGWEVLADRVLEWCAAHSGQAGAGTGDGRPKPRGSVLT